ncbi:MAG: hypothetical protein K6U12_10185 [Armatimonadetes bacterium]|nr:hypothetical protein [Armatimonadota bacterium]CUU35877.1 hypothetical protein DCOP10_116105 [Armatimonadetes bacterium DC]
MRGYIERLIVGTFSVLFALLATLLVRSIWATHETLHWQDVVWCLSLITLFWTGYAITDPSPSQNGLPAGSLVVVEVRIPVPAFILFAWLIPLVAISISSAPLSWWNYISLGMTSAAGWVMGVICGALRHRSLGLFWNILKSTSKLRLCVLVAIK